MKKVTSIIILLTIWDFGNAQCTADVNGFGYFGCGPLTVNFSDASTNAVTWNWDFGDGDISNIQNPTHIYTTPGIYTATLTITDGLGCSDVITKTNFVQVIGPNVNFGADTLYACSSLIVNFTDSTIFGAPIISWNWNFGDGNSSSLQSPTHTYINPGNFDVSLIVSDIDGCSRTFTRTQYINIFSSVTGTDIRTECNSYTWIDGNTYTTSNNFATHNIIGGTANGCDSLVTLDLTINSVSDITIATSGTTISANNIGATYKWLDCDDNNAVIVGETGQSFEALSNGNYAVELTENSCVDTSACVSITTVGLIENNFGNKFNTYPNPTDGNFYIDLGYVYKNVDILITDLSGKLIDSKTITQSQTLYLSIEEPAGTYIISIQAGDKKAVIRLIKE